MTNPGYKLQEFVAHSTSVRCLSIGRKARRRRLLLTGGEDQRVNLWAIGKPSSLLSLSGHSSSVESVAFNSAEILVLAGASSGALKLWDLEESKLLRSLTGHKSKCTGIDFHPFGEFFASGSVDKDLKIWDIRKKGCIHTYKGHRIGINTIKFSPDGRWVVSGGLDNVVKVWDLTAGKLLHDFNFHDGPITSIAFHPLEFLLATGSADKTVKFWDLETFEMIGSTRIEAEGVRAMSFHPDGRTLFCGNDKNMKVYSWEPVICHASVDMGWSTLADLCIHEQRLTGCSFYRHCVGIWAADLSLIKPYGTTEDNGPVELKPELHESDSLSSVGFRSLSPDVDTKEIKNIYVDSADEQPVNPAAAISTKSVGHFTSKSSVEEPCIVLGETSVVNYFNRKESFSPARASTHIPFTPFYARRALENKYDMKSLLLNESRSFNSATGSISDGLVSDTSSRDSVEEKYPIQNNVEDRMTQDLARLVHPEVETVDESLDQQKPAKKVINGAAIAHGRTRSLVEKFERWEKATISREDETVDSGFSSEVLADRVKSSTRVNEEPQVSGRDLSSPSDGNIIEDMMQLQNEEPQISGRDLSSPRNEDIIEDMMQLQNEEPQISGRDLSSPSNEDIIEDLMQNHENVLSSLRFRLNKLQMVRRLWEQNDFKGAIKMTKKFPDHSVQADVVGVFMDKMEIINLDLFSCLLPVLVNLLDSTTERHAKMSLEMLLKLVAAFGQTIFSVISAPPCVGVDLHQQERIECCRKCFNQLHKLQTVLPEITRRSGLLAKLGQELNLILQVHNIS